MVTQQQSFAIAGQAKQALEKIYGDRLRDVFVFGSFARGEMAEDSDLDVAVVLDTVESRFAERGRIGALATDLSLSSGILVSFVFVEESDYRCGRYAVYRAIRREGVRV